jgi:hypothetical protein
MALLSKNSLSSRQQGTPPANQQQQSSWQPRRALIINHTTRLTFYSESQLRGSSQATGIKLLSSDSSLDDDDAKAEAKAAAAADDKPDDRPDDDFIDINDFNQSRITE